METVKTRARGWSLRLEWKPQDLWVGVYWKRSRTAFLAFLDVWVCLVPCVPIHFEAWRPVPPPRPRHDACPECGGFGPPCCERMGRYNGSGSDGPLLFHCPKGCPCHD